MEKKRAEEKYNDTKEKWENTSLTEKTERIHYENEMEKYKRQFTRISQEEIVKVKELLDAHGVNYYQAEYEADEVCVEIIRHNIAWGCLSDDMDMLLYDCPYILRNLSLLQHTVFLYDKKRILEDLDMTKEIFLRLVLLSGTDYNTSNLSLDELLEKWYRHTTTNDEWLVKEATEEFEKVYQLFNTPSSSLSYLDTIKLTTKKPKVLERIKTIMKEEGFLFI
jgi:5'-3' exonuclease